MRFIGGTDSRTWVMQLVRTDTGAVIPFWQIGTEQGLLNHPVQREEMDLMPGERLDVLVDFTGIPVGTRVMMKNLGNDDPWPGYFDYIANKLGGTWPPSETIPEIMAFDVVSMPLGPDGINPVTDNISRPAVTNSLRPLIAPIPAAGAVPPGGIQNTRVVSLMEITDGYGRTMPTIDSRGFKPPGVPLTEIIKLYDTEQWDIVNTTVDAHPMHLHQVAFKVIDRQALVVDPDGTVSSFTPPNDDIINQVFTPPSYTVDPASSPIPPNAWDDGWKDTVATPPGYVTRVWARFDLTGEYVWHCHILSHEEHDMMRNFIVTDANFSAPAPAKLTVPATSSTGGSYIVSWVGTAIPGVVYELQEATDSAFATATTVQNSAAPRFVTTKTSNNTFYYRVRALPPETSRFTTSAWKTAANPVSVQLPVVITTAALPAATVNAPYSTALTALNGFAPYTWSVTGLPASLTMSAVGVLSGTPTPADVPTGASATYPVTITVKDSLTPATSVTVVINLIINQVLPAAPSALTASATRISGKILLGTVTLKWVDNANNETGFQIQQAFTPLFLSPKTFSVGANTSMLTQKVLRKITYYYRVRAINAKGNSAWSNIVKVTSP
ncbi:MAG: multicopper oxidase domain-containing protein [Deltaproteobacteria bacterium]|nr:multicopper oxidase domain-containing protein [Deltaproteobacteria bacterium]